jgi:hypothetical protein
MWPAGQVLGPETPAAAGDRAFSDAFDCGQSGVKPRRSAVQTATITIGPRGV